MEARVGQERNLPQRDFEIVDIGLENRFNAAAWSTTDGAIMLLVREVKKAAEEGNPDVGPLVILKKNARMVEVRLEDYDSVADKVVWDPEGKDVLLEDPRALPDGIGVILGLTAVDQKVPYPAIIHISKDQFEEIDDRQVWIIRDLGPGKNTTPLDDGTFLFRKEGDENNHRLTRFSIDTNTNKVKELESIEFPLDLEWASWRTGTTMPPIRISDSEYLMIFHGIKRENGKDTYSLGRAKLLKDHNGNLTVAEVDRKPILTPDDFVINGRPITTELHPNLKCVVYLCGGIMENENRRLSLFVNVGDTKTELVTFPFDALVTFDKPLRHQKQYAA